MKKILGILLIALFIASGNLYAEDVTTVEAKGDDISDNLDLQAVASVFGEAKDLEEFEAKLNDPETRISNLDLNEDGKVDYLRVVETSKDNTRLVTIQAVIGKDQYQDVATIDVEKDSEGQLQVQVVGDVFMYGPGYIVQPVYAHPPVIYYFFWGPYYHPWYSPFYWGYYPPYYHPWHPYPRYRYQRNIDVHINRNNSYSYTSVRKSKTSIELQKKTRRNDFEAKNPNKSFSKRNEGMKNRKELNQKRAKLKVSDSQVKAAKTSTGRQVQKDWKPAAERTGTKGNIRNGKVSVPSKKIQSKPKTSKSKNNIKSNRGETKQQIGRPSSGRPTGRPSPGRPTGELKRR